ncbi:WD40/YVTN/BNR-like repeat-containing protein [Vreelandella sp. F11]|uniref:WD40/YVTN/BNR-like repeat-containing protein n=1 Tax=Vreelandella sp. F11 TaxID=3394751 RepID=UPI0036D78E83
MQRSRWAIATVVILVAGYVIGSGGMWERVSNDFMKEDTPYGPGDFRMRNEQILSMKLTNPEITFKPREERSDPNRAEPTEAWMGNVSERANRRTVRILSGSLEQGVERRFEEPAQQADWWLSPDWNTLYLATGWMDYHMNPAPGERYTPQLTQLFKSTDQGESWEKLRWPEDQNISTFRFLDAQRGYLIGWGPHVWRTEDGGEHWEEIPVPAESRDPENERKRFDLVALGQDNVLRMAFFDQARGESVIYALPWGETEPRFEVAVGDYGVNDIAANEQGEVYILARKGRPTSLMPKEQLVHHPTSIWHWNGDQLTELHEFDSDLVGYALYITPEEGLLFDGVNEGSLLGKDVTAVSYDGGADWRIEDEGRSAQGGYYDTRTGERWRVAGYSLYRREIP